MNTTYRVWISRRFWPWPKKYVCKGVMWGLYDMVPTEDGEGRVERLLSPNFVVLILLDERKVFINTVGRVITYSRDFFEHTLQDMESTIGQKIPIKGKLMNVSVS